MRRNGLVFALVTALALTTTLASAAVRPDGSLGYLTEPSDGAPLDIARDYLQAHQDALGLVAGDLDSVIVTDNYRTKHNGVTHIYLRQTLNGAEVVNANVSIHVASDGRIINQGGRFFGDLAGNANAVSPRVSQEDAILAAAVHVGLPATAQLRHLSSEAGSDLASLFENSRLSTEEIPVRLRYFGTESGELRLAWETRFRLPNGLHWWTVRVDAERGDVLDKVDWIAQESYNVFAYPKESPLDGDQTVETDPANPVASPFGWHDTDGANGPEFNDTRGNNVEAQEDVDANNVPGERPTGGPGNDYDVEFNPELSPANNIAQATINLFYWNNVTHDLMYLYGFDEVSGNFQTNNYGRGGAEGDPVQADAQDGSGTNNANFATPPDGSDPRMQMFIWTNPFGQLVTVNSPSQIADSYVANPSNSGGLGNGLTADLVIVDDGVEPTDDSCESVLNDLTGKIAVIVWSEGLCNSSVFVLNAANAGAVGAIIVDNTDEPFTNFGGTNAIPSVGIGRADGELLIATLESGSTVNATLEDNLDAAPDRDSDNDNGIIVHEYGHGVSNRLTGGPSQTGCLSTSEQMGEGWSDWLGLVMTAVETDTGPMVRGIGNYATFRPEDGVGIRNFPYSTDFNINPQTYADIATTNIPHGVGEVWAQMTWDMYWALTDRYGWGDVFTEPDSGPGIALQLVMDGMKLQPCSPTFESGRDAILDADMINNGGANECLIWEAFADRGMGFSADAGGGSNIDGTEAFDLPPQCGGNTSPVLSLSGSCPGSVSIEVTGATPNGAVRLYYSESNGTTVVQQGQCAGLELNLDNARLATTLTANGAGIASGTFPAGSNQCGLELQAADEGTCEPSNGFQVP